MKFVDQVIIEVTAGDGGDGCVSFRREKYVPFGGPNGGNGGDGGSVYFIGNKHLQTLADLEYRCSYRAERGAHGQGKNRHGKNGNNIFIPVPLGTDIFDATTNKKIGEILEPNQTLLVARGGKGGRGNSAFVSATNRAPRIREKGKKGEKQKLKLILRLIADIGLIGLPNAGKSTLLAKITSAQPKIADYPFTTLTPNLGILTTEKQSITVADMPGIIEGASQGKGLGLVFLRHIERTKILIYVIDISREDPIRDFKIIQDEIRKYNPEILNKTQIVIFNKIDLLTDEKYEVLRKKLSCLKNIPTFFVSAKENIGVAELIAYIGKL